jgi:hypothetical protein
MSYRAFRRAATRCARRRRLAHALALALCAGTAQAATFTAGSEAELNSAINSANAATGADTISITADITLTAALPAIIDTLTIQGSGGNRTIRRDDSGTNACSPTATNAFRLLDASADLTLNDLTLSGGCNLADQGGAVRVQGAALTMARSTVSGNQTFFPDPDPYAYCYGQCNGGGIAVLYGSASISDSTLSGNAVHGNNASGGGIALFQSDLVMSQSTVSGNSVTGVNIGGGGVYGYGAYGVVGTIAITDCTITGNTGIAEKGYGGGVAMFFEDTTISRSGIAGNQLGNGSTYFGFGGGIHAGGGTLAVVDSALTGNSVTATATARAGAIAVWQAAATVTNSTLSGNSVDNASTSGGGAIMVHSEDDYAASLTLRNSTVSGNSSSHGGGGIYLKRENATSVIPTATIESSIVAGNQGAAGLDAIGTEATTPALVSADHSLIQGSVDTGTGSFTPDAATSALLGADPLLQALANNGGPTPTQALAAGSPAIDRGLNSQNLANDQRGTGYARVVGAAADIGAFEFGAGSSLAQGSDVMVPALSNWALGLLAGLLALLGWRRAMPMR